MATDADYERFLDKIRPALNVSDNTIGSFRLGDWPPETVRTCFNRMIAEAQNRQKPPRRRQVDKWFGWLPKKPFYFGMVLAFVVGTIGAMSYIGHHKDGGWFVNACIIPVFVGYAAQFRIWDLGAQQYLAGKDGAIFVLVNCAALVIVVKLYLASRPVECTCLILGIAYEFFKLADSTIFIGTFR